MAKRPIRRRHCRHTRNWRDKIMKEATRQSFGQALAIAAGQDPCIIVLDADLAPATKTDLTKKEYPAQFLEAGIAEANMVGIAAGLAASGLKPFASSFAMFLAGRAYEQIRNSVAYPHLNVKLCGTHAGITVGEDGGSHQCLEDIGLMRALPGMMVLQPADHYEAMAMVKMLASYEGPAYLRLSRNAVERVFDASFEFELGAIRQVHPGQSIAFLASGVMVQECIEAARQLESAGIDAAVYNLSTIKPLNKERLDEIIRAYEYVYVAEEHWKAGGIWSAVMETAAEPQKVGSIAVEERFGQSGSAAELMEEYGLSAACIVRRVLNDALRSREIEYMPVRKSVSRCQI